MYRRIREAAAAPIACKSREYQAQYAKRPFLRTVLFKIDRPTLAATSSSRMLRPRGGRLDYPHARTKRIKRTLAR
jgi:hypothetical protein